MSSFGPWDFGDYLYVALLVAFVCVCFCENRGETEFHQEMLGFLVFGLFVFSVPGLVLGALALVAAVWKGRWVVYKLERAMEDEMKNSQAGSSGREGP